MLGSDNLALFFFLLAPLVTSAANSFSGANNYYAYALPEIDRITLLDGMQTAGMKVLRTWVSGQSAGQKGSDSIAVSDLEANGIGNYNDTILDLIDQLMVDAHARGIKLLIGVFKHIPGYQNSWLKSGDIYGSTYGIEGFYTSTDAINAFNQRITHILNIHKNSLLGNQPWSELGGYIFGYEAQNEFDHLPWVCDCALQIRNNVGDNNQVIFTGGGSAASSVQSTFFSNSCAIDVVAVHDYNDDYDNFMSSAVSQAQAAGKKLLVEEWGSLAPSGSARTANLESNVQKINNYKVPWFYWELITNADPGEGQDYEIEVNGADWNAISDLSETTAAITNAAFDFSASLAL
ncbi:glycoside hydrolase family 5 protein [Lentinula aciculospora]|uniref:Glycoside hydrolase family 5 protein n=1 Tax=Lentinula aciculospora TaxID=153920 RepID=A0A9W9DH44_9AGAR|nr:glycoside hydrolase family 5 protein [Lentinula aciculospora]